jgi:hypothetical protein
MTQRDFRCRCNRAGMTGRVLVAPRFADDALGYICFTAPAGLDFSHQGASRIHRTREKMAERGCKMAFHRLFGRSAVTVLLAAIGVKTGAAADENAVPSPSVADRVAAIRAKAAELSATVSLDGATQSTGRPAQVAWNDWKNE